MEESKGKRIINHLKEKWGLTSIWQVLIIIVVFAVTGSSAVWVGKPILNFFGINNEMPYWLHLTLRIAIIFPVYQVLLLFWGTLFGQFRFFWNLEKKTLGRLVGKKGK